MVRYLPLLTECGYRVGYKCAQPGLGKLLRQSFPSDLHFQDEAHIKNNKPVPLRAPTYLFQQQYLCRAFNGKLTPRGVGSGRPNQKLEYRPRKKVNPVRSREAVSPRRSCQGRALPPEDTIGRCWLGLGLWGDRHRMGAPDAAAQVVAAGRPGADIREVPLRFAAGWSSPRTDRRHAGIGCAAAQAGLG